jgi:glycosyltransferase involved in cell wall biosynthesis
MMGHQAMADNDAVLVLIPSYNHGRFLHYRVMSVLNQGYQNLDVMLIDDGSTDNTMEVVRSIKDPRFKAVQREVNSGTPFAAWHDAQRIIEAGNYRYIWIAESDDRAAPDFLSRGVAALRANPAASLYFCHSWFVDERDLILGHSISYLRRHFPSVDWSEGWTMHGTAFVRATLIRGMSVPNMSSALMRADAFCAALTPDLARYKLAADWIFAASIARHGDVIFDPVDNNFFRHHSRTSRSETALARVVFEHMSATYAAYRFGEVDRADYQTQMKIWGQMYRYERVRFDEFWRVGRMISTARLVRFLPFVMIR